MEYGPNSSSVVELITALRDPALRRRRVPRTSPMLFSVNVRLHLAGRDDAAARAIGAALEACVPSHRSSAAALTSALVGGDLLPDAMWAYYTETPLGRAVGMGRPGGPLAERCPCGSQTGERLLAARAPASVVPRAPESRRDSRVHAFGAPCAHTVPSLPTVEAVAVAMHLAVDWDGEDWVQILSVARRLSGTT